MLGLASLVQASMGLARPALRLGGDWAGWRCGFDPISGGIVGSASRQSVTTERWSGRTLQRRSLQIVPEGRSDDAALSDGEEWSSLPVANSGRSSLFPGARSGLFGAVDVDMLNANAWALDVAHSPDSWWCESVFDGLGGDQPADERCERTRVACTFNPNTGELTAEPVLVWQERCFSVRPSADLPLRAGSGLNAAFVDSVAGLDCFGEQKRIPYAMAMFSRAHLSLPGGVELRGRPGLLEVFVTASPGKANWRKLLLRRSWIGGSCYAYVETVGDTRLDAEPRFDEYTEDGFSELQE